jgi:hypothetical protein
MCHQILLQLIDFYKEVIKQRHVVALFDTSKKSMAKRCGQQIQWVGDR